MPVVVLTDDAGRRVLGRYTGAAYSFGADVGGTLGPKDDVAMVVTSIANIITTIKGTWPPNPKLGSKVPTLLFEPLDEVTLSLVRHFTFQDLSEQEPRIRVETVYSRQTGLYSVQVVPAFSLIGDPFARVLNAPLLFTREGF